MAQRTLDSSPRILPLYARAAAQMLPGASLLPFVPGRGEEVPDTELVLPEVRPDPEKVSPYECGFEAFDDARRQFDVRFYLVAILFIIFDLEVAFLFPWVVAFKSVGRFGLWSVMVFLGVLTIGFIYEWKKGALEWD